MKNILLKKFGVNKLVCFLIVIDIAILGVLVGSFLDLQISQTIASNTNVFGLIFESFGELIGYGIAPIAGGMFLKVLAKKDNPLWKRILGIFLFSLMVVVTSYIMSSAFSGQPGYAWKFNKTLGIVICFVIYLGVALLSYYLTDSTLNEKTLLKNASILALSIIVPLIVMNLVLKGLAYRPRYRAMVWNNEVNGTLAFGLEHYKNWWEFSFFKKPDWFLALGYESDYIKSWPSGHTSTAAATIALPFFISSSKLKGERNETITFICAGIYTFLTGFMRIVRGAHFLSDISFGALFTFLIVMLIIFVANKAVKE